MNFLKFGCLAVFLFCMTSRVYAHNELDVVINEIAWMGATSSYNDEWIELYNNSPEEISLKGWILRSEDGSPEIILEGVIPASGFFVLERTSDATLPDIKANLLYKGALNNGGESLILTDKEGKIIDAVSCAKGWFAGDNPTKRTMERKNPDNSGSSKANWQTSQFSGGTPGALNSQPAPEPSRESPSLGIEESAASLSDSLERGQNPVFFFLIALVIATLSSLALLLFKRRIIKKKISI